jgi:hypothetical protein
MIDLERFDPTDANTGMKAAERANRLERVILEYLAKASVDPRFVVKFKKVIASHCPARKDEA